MRVLARGVWRDHRLSPARLKPIAEAAGVIGAVGDEAQWAGHHSQQRTGTVEVMNIASGEFEGAGPTALVGQRVDFRRAAAARAPDRRAEGPPFAPAAERCALMCVESIAPVPIIPVEPVNA